MIRKSCFDCHSKCNIYVFKVSKKLFNRCFCINCKSYLPPQLTLCNESRDIRHFFYMSDKSLKSCICIGFYILQRILYHKVYFQLYLFGIFGKWSRIHPCGIWSKLPVKYIYVYAVCKWQNNLHFLLYITPLFLKNTRDYFQVKWITNFTHVTRLLCLESF